MTPLSSFPNTKRPLRTTSCDGLGPVPRAMRSLPQFKLGSDDPRLLLFRQIKRELVCAGTLLDRLRESYSASNPDGFRNKAAAEAVELSTTTFGMALLRVIAHVYYDEARVQLSTFSSVVLTMKRSGETVNDSTALTYYGVKLFGGVRGSLQAMQELEETETKVQDSLKDDFVLVDNEGRTTSEATVSGVGVEEEKDAGGEKEVHVADEGAPGHSNGGGQAEESDWTFINYFFGSSSSSTVPAPAPPGSAPTATPSECQSPRADREDKGHGDHRGSPDASARATGVGVGSGSSGVGGEDGKRAKSAAVVRERVVEEEVRRRTADQRKALDAYLYDSLGQW